MSRFQQDPISGVAAQLLGMGQSNLQAEADRQQQQLLQREKIQADLANTTLQLAAQERQAQADRAHEQQQLATQGDQQALLQKMQNDSFAAKNAADLQREQLRIQHQQQENELVRKHSERMMKEAEANQRQREQKQLEYQAARRRGEVELAIEAAKSEAQFGREVRRIETEMGKLQQGRIALEALREGKTTEMYEALKTYKATVAARDASIESEAARTVIGAMETVDLGIDEIIVGQQRVPGMGTLTASVDMNFESFEKHGKEVVQGITNQIFEKAKFFTGDNAGDKAFLTNKLIQDVVSANFHAQVHGQADDKALAAHQADIRKRLADLKAKGVTEHELATILDATESAVVSWLEQADEATIRSGATPKQVRVLKQKENMEGIAQAFSGLKLQARNAFPSGSKDGRFDKTDVEAIDKQFRDAIVTMFDSDFLTDQEKEIAFSNIGDPDLRKALLDADTSLRAFDKRRRENLGIDADITDSELEQALQGQLDTAEQQRINREEGFLNRELDASDVALSNLIGG